MATSLTRSMLTSNRRSANLNGTRPRAHATHPEDYDDDAAANDLRLNESESQASDQFQDKGSENLGRNANTSEYRSEKKTVLARERILRRSPVKKFASGRKSANFDSQSRGMESPTLSRKDDVQETADSWIPQVTLVPHSSAPLASRISTPPRSSVAPRALVSGNFPKLSVRKQEQLLLDDLLYVFMGHEGRYVQFLDSYNPSEERDRLAGPDFHILPGLDPSLKDLTTSMLKMATHYSAMEAFIEMQSREEYGCVAHALCATIRRLLKDYLILVAQLEMKVIGDLSLTLHQMHLHTIPTAQSLDVLYSLGQELLRRNSLLEEGSDDLLEDFDDADNLIQRLRDGGDLLPGSMAKNKCIGGCVLAMLTQRLKVYSGDPAAKKLLEMLLRESSRPYVTMLNEWLHHGAIKDPHSEFLIGERSGIKRERMDEDYTDEYWEKRYYIRDREVPPQLEAMKEKILLAGKYLNVVRECGGVNVSQETREIPQTFSDPDFLDNINISYAHANHSLLSVLLVNNSLRNRLRSLKHYFFLDRAEFFLYFLELAGSELRKPNTSVNIGKLQSLLDLVLHQPGSIAAADPFKEDVEVKMNEMSLTQWLMKIVTVQGIDQENPHATMAKYQATPAPNEAKDNEKEINGFDALELDYAVPFPLSLVISRKTVLRYQLLFRYTLALRHLETMLVGCWTEHTKTQSWIHKSKAPRIETWKRRAWTLRARMLIFVQQMLFFATVEVIEPNWQKLMTKVDEAEASDVNYSNPDLGAQQGSWADAAKPRRTRTVDELMQDHLDMLDSCMKDLGLTQGKLLKIHAKLTMGCTMFASYTSSLSRSLYSVDPDLGSVSNRTEDSGHEAGQRAVSGSHSSASEIGGGQADPSRIAKMEETLRKYEDHFNRHLRILIDSLNYYAATETVVLLGLCARLTAAEVGGNRDRDGLF